MCSKGPLHIVIELCSSKNCKYRYFLTQICLNIFFKHIFVGDSGGPLIVKDMNGRYTLVGITSAGFGCGIDHQPGIYHNVQMTSKWIQDMIYQTFI